MKCIEIEGKKFDLFLEKDTIDKRNRLLGVQINVDYEGKRPILLGILNGSFMFMSDLLKEINLACEISFMQVSSYKGDQSTGEVKEIIGLSSTLKGRDILIVEDIIDSGHTLQFIIEKLKTLEPASIQVCTLLFKPNAVKVDIPEIAYIGFEISNEFVVGYGLDYDGLGRNLKDIYRAI
ncbi:MAG: hypoxanthine phosphoribosyltransferase [Pedobacter sp.]|nr:MAG: hypoxanthine phosphoribosyltransferase [Pedobacter sp.]